MQLPTRVSMPVLTGLRNLPFVVGEAIAFAYPVELTAEDVTVGVSIVEAALIVAPEFGQPSTITKTITSAQTAAGRITDSGSNDGLGALTFSVDGAETAGWTIRQAFQVIVSDSLGRQTPLDSGYLVPVTGGESIYSAVDRVIISPTEATVNAGSTLQLSAVPADAAGHVLTDRVMTWSTSDAGVATVSQAGLVTPAGLGMADITATSDGVSASSKVTSAGTVFDTFTRPDDATTLGVADTGQTWTAFEGVFGILGGRARLETDAGHGKNADVVASGTSDGTISVLIAEFANSMGLVFRATDEDNGFIAICHGGDGFVNRHQAGVVTTIAVSATGFATADTPSVVLLGPSIAFYKNGALLCSASDAFNQGVQNHGIGGDTDAVGGLFDDFQVAA